MAKFAFRLQALLAFRARREEQAKLAYTGKRLEIEGVESAIRDIRDSRARKFTLARIGIDDFVALERCLLVLDEREREQRIILEVLEQEAERLRELWIAAKQDLEAIARLREKRYSEWLYLEDRTEQNALDEWATLGRAS